MTEVTPQSDPAGTTLGSDSASVQKAAGPGPGALLLAARERLGVSTQEVADELKLPNHVIEALENDDYERMPSSVFSRGYLRSYARLLDLDPETLLKLYLQLSQKPEASTQAAVVPFWRKLDLVQIAAIVGAGLVGVLVLLSLLFGGAEQEDPGNAEPEPVVGTATAVSDREVGFTAPAPIASMAAGSSESEAESDSAEDVIRVEVEDPVPVAASEVTEPSTTALVPLPGGVRRITETGEDRLTLTFSSDCWVEVTSLDGESLYSDLGRSGRLLELVGRGPFRVRLGYAPGVDLSFNGEPVPLAGRTRNNVANLVLGQ